MFYFTPLPGFFSPFPHGTGSLSVIQSYLALDDGPPRFLQDFSCLAVLRNTTIRLYPFVYRPITFYGYAFQHILLGYNFVTDCYWYSNNVLCPTTPPMQHLYVTNTLMVWAIPVSLAATQGISIDFFSSGYLDVSVHQVPFLTLYIQVRIH